MDKKQANNLDGCTVEPLRELAHIKAIEELLADKPRDLLLFTLGVNCGLRAVDILRLKVSHLLGKAINTRVDVYESKTDKSNFIVVNSKIHRVFNQYMAAYDRGPDDYLFKSHRGAGPLTSSAVGKKIRRWCKAIGLCEHRYGTHTMRKTFGYVNRVHRGVGIEILMERYNHSSAKITLKYLCITRHEVAEIMEKPI